MYLSKWFSFCGNKINIIQPSINVILKFLSQLYVQGLQYRSLGTARSAISTFLKICSNIDINSYEEITRFKKGVYVARPALPRYTTWSVDTVLNYLSSTQTKTLLQLSCKLTMLFLLLSAQRSQTLHLIELKDVKVEKDKVSIAPNHLLKQTKPGKHLNIITFKGYDKDAGLCIVRTFSEYMIERTRTLRTNDKLLISTIKPHDPVSKSTISRWVKMVLGQAGLDLTFKPHSIRAAAT